MRLVLGENREGPLVSSAILGAAVLLLCFTVFGGARLTVVAPILAFVVFCATTYRWLLAWRSLVALIVVVILFIPMRRYTLPSALPFNLEPYRLLVALVGVGWITSLLIDPRVRLRKSVVDAPLVAFVFAVFLSLAVNRHRVGSVEAEVIKKLLFFASFFLVSYLIISVVRSLDDIDFIVRVLAYGGSFVALFAMVERSTGYDLFDHVQSVLPFLKTNAAAIQHFTRGGRLRVYASAQHPIALGAALAMLIPLAIYRAAAFKQRRWWALTLLLVVGSLSSGSRTPVIQILVIAIVFLRARPVSVRRFWPAIIPAMVVIHFAAPGAIGTAFGSFFPRGGLVAQQQNAAVGSGRLATAGPAIRAELLPNPLFGEGFGTRVTTPTPAVPVPNAPILDDGWLGILLETGVVGAFAFVWLFVRFVRRLIPAAKADDTARGWLLTATAASVASFGASMFFYDAFSFIQSTFLLFILIGLGAAALEAPSAHPARSPVRRALPRLAPSPQRFQRPGGNLA